ncbi:SRPBCC family protein [Ascidiimonas aurantiaca]|uniref:SRPBCC family protein n=1 Tax=Ascidiimonas aurantiaca TaxID=1685432 RepID=UPI0030EF0053
MSKILLYTQIKADKHLVFDLSRSIDLHKISTRHTNETAIAGKTQGLILMDETVTWRARHFGIYQYMTVKITVYNRPDYFTDEMVSGPFKHFKHEHRFISQKEGTLMVDVFEYTSPFGLLGKLFDVIILKRYMEKLLQKRNLIIKDFAETHKWKNVLKS